MAASNMAAKTTNTANTLYSRFKNAMAPSRTAAPISNMRAVPGSCRLIHCVRHQANASASNPDPMAKLSKLFVLMVKRFSFRVVQISWILG